MDERTDAVQRHVTRLQRLDLLRQRQRHPWDHGERCAADTGRPAELTG